MEVVPRVAEAVQRLKAVFLEMPGTQLRPLQASKLSGLESPLGECVLATLADTGLLKRDLRGCTAGE